MSSPVPNVVMPVPNMEQRNKGVYRHMEGFYRLEKYPATIIRYIMVFSSIALGLLMASQVFLRYVLKLPFLGMEELAPMLALWAYFLGMGYSARVREHISGGILTLVCKNRKIIKVIRLFGSIVCLAVVCVFGFYAYRIAMFNVGLGRLSIYMRFPKYLWDFSVVFGFCLSGFYFVLQIILEFFDLAQEFSVTLGQAQPVDE